MNPIFLFGDGVTPLKKLLALKATGGIGGIRDYTATGNPVSFTTNLAYPMKLEMPFTPVQDLHGYDAPWVGGAGKNIFDKTISKDDAHIRNTDGNLATSASGNGFTDGYIPVEPETAYTLSGDIGIGSGQRVYYLDSNKEWISRSGQYTSVPATFTTPSGCYFMQLQYNVATVNWDTVQLEKGSSATTYAPYSNICPISGWAGAEISRTGKNLFDKTQNPLVAGNGYKYYLDSSGAHDLKCNSTSTAVTVAVPCIPNTKYTAQITSAGSIFRFCYCKETSFATKIASGNTISTYGFQTTSATGSKSLTLTTGDEATYLILQVYADSYATDKDSLMISMSETASTYEAFTGYNTYSIPFPDPPGTVYGGTLTVNKDGSGKIAVEKVTGTLSQSNTWVAMQSGNTKYFRTRIAGVKEAVANTIICDKLPSVLVNKNTTDLGIDNNNIASDENYSNACVRVASNMSDNDFAVWITANQLQIVYELATPVEYDLTAEEIDSIVGKNNVWSDTNGTNTITYSKRG